MNPEPEWITQDVPELRILDGALWPWRRNASARPNGIAATTATPRTMSGNAGVPNPLLGPDQVRLPRWRLFDDLGRSGRLLDGTQQRHQRQLKEDPPRPTRSTGAERAAPSADGPCAVQGVLRRVHARDEPAAHGGSIDAAEAEIKKIDRDQDTHLNLVLGGGAAERFHETMVGLERRQKNLKAILQEAKESPSLPHPNMPRQHIQIDELYAALQKDLEAKWMVAADVLRSLSARSNHRSKAKGLPEGWADRKSRWLRGRIDQDLRT